MTIMHIDGSEGEGGGQILRSSMALAVLSRTPIEITNIRAGRKKPGLKRQHLTSVRAVAQICGPDATLTGDEPESQALAFTPAPPRPGEYTFSVGTAGSSTLVLQTVLPLLILADEPSTVTVEGGTHNDMAPPSDFLDRCFLPLLQRMGATVDLRLERHGFFPAGGGRLVAQITPTPTLTGFDLLHRGVLRREHATALLSKLPDDVGQRQVKTIRRLLGWPADQANTTVAHVESPGPGTACMVELDYEHVSELVTGVGRRGVRAEQVAKRAVRDVRSYLSHDAPVGEHLADQLLMPLAISASQDASTPARRGGSFRTGPLSMHTRTHIDILSRFLPVAIDVTDKADGTFLITVSPR